MVPLAILTDGSAAAALAKASSAAVLAYGGAAAAVARVIFAAAHQSRSRRSFGIAFRCGRAYRWRRRRSSCMSAVLTDGGAAEALAFYHAAVLTYGGAAAALA